MTPPRVAGSLLGRKVPLRKRAYFVQAKGLLQIMNGGFLWGHEVLSKIVGGSLTGQTDKP